jgi:hypothetical protein
VPLSNILRNAEIFGDRVWLIKKLRAGWREAKDRENRIIGTSSYLPTEARGVWRPRTLALGDLSLRKDPRRWLRTASDDGFCLDACERVHNLSHLD